MCRQAKGSLVVSGGRYRVGNYVGALEAPSKLQHAGCQGSFMEELQRSGLYPAGCARGGATVGSGGADLLLAPTPCRASWAFRLTCERHPSRAECFWGLLS